MNNTRLAEVQALIDKANHAYYSWGDSTMEDAKYDALKDELKLLNPSDPRLGSVGASIRSNILQRKSHTIPMGSLNKASNQTEFFDWFKNSIIKNGLSSISVFHASHKMDGGSYSLEYKNGKLISAISRGDGLVGEDISANAIKFKNIPLKCICANGTPFSGFIRGEVVLENKEWKMVDPDSISNPRNLAVGIARRKDGSQSEYLKFYAFRIFDEDGDIFGDTEEELSLHLKKMGFDVAPYFMGNIKDVWDWYLKIQSERSTLQYWVDGIVIKLNDLEKQLNLDKSSGNPIAQVAIKFAAEGGKTVLRNVTIQVGSTGAIVPVANFDSVKIGGTNIVNATLCNWDNIRDLGVCIGDEIYVIKAGDIIPRIMEVTKKDSSRISIPEPTHCPVCNSKTEHKSNVGGGASTSIYCSNNNCPAVVTGKIDKYLTSLDILGVGETLIEALVKDIGTTTIADLYTLKDFRNEIADIILSGKVRLGEKRADKFLEAIEEKRKLTLSDFLGSLGIFGLGKRRVALIQDAMDGQMDDLNSWFDGTLTLNARKAGVPNIASRIQDELNIYKSLIMECIRNGVIILPPVPKQAIRDGAYVICITGALSAPKKHFQELIEKSENVYTDTFSKSVTHLVSADVNSGSSKLKKALKQGTKVISEQELIDLIKQ